MQIGEPVLACSSSPNVDDLFDARNLLGSIHDQDWISVNPEIAIIAQKRDNPINEALRIAGLIFLGHQDLVLGSIPTPCPILVRPAKTKRHVTYGISKHRIHRNIEQSFAGEPVIMITERINTE
jgi:hypothetical protein